MASKHSYQNNPLPGASNEETGIGIQDISPKGTQSVIPEVSFRLELDPKQTCCNKSLISPSGSSPNGAELPGTMQKCLSFPRIVTDLPNSWSIGSCQSRTCLDSCYPQSLLGGSEKSVDPDRLSIAGNAGLLRSISARTVDLETKGEPDNSLNSSDSDSRYLSPGDRADPLSNRSTSCPSMACCEVSYGKERGLPPGTSNDVRRMLFGGQKQDEDDIDLAGEEIDDLPIEPNSIFPELPPDLVDDAIRSKYAAGERAQEAEGELSLKYLKINDGNDNSKSREGQRIKVVINEEKKNSASAETRTGSDPKHIGTKEQYINIRDLPSTAGTADRAKQVKGQLRASIQAEETNQKCLRWLNALPFQRS